MTFFHSFLSLLFNGAKKVKIEKVKENIFIIFHKNYDFMKITYESNIYS